MIIIYDLYITHSNETKCEWNNHVSQVTPDNTVEEWVSMLQFVTFDKVIPIFLTCK